MECPSCGGSVRPTNGFYVCQDCGLCQDRDYRPSPEALTGGSHHILAAMGTVVGKAPATQRLRRRQDEHDKHERLCRVCSRILRTGHQLGFSKLQLNQATYLATQLLPQIPRGDGEKLGLAVLCIVARQYRLPLSVPQLLDAYRLQGCRMKARDLMRFLLKHPVSGWIPSGHDWQVYLPEALDVALRYLQNAFQDSNLNPSASPISCQGVDTLSATRVQLQDAAQQLLTKLSPVRITKALVASAVYAACRQLGARVPVTAWLGTGLKTYTLRTAWVEHFRPQRATQHGQS